MATDCWQDSCAFGTVTAPSGVPLRSRAIGSRPPPRRATDNRTSGHRKGGFFHGYGGCHGDPRLSTSWAGVSNVRRCGARARLERQSELPGSGAHPRVSRARRPCSRERPPARCRRAQCMAGRDGAVVSPNRDRQGREPARSVAPSAPAPILQALRGLARRSDRRGGFGRPPRCFNVPLFFPRKCIALPAILPQPRPRRSISRESPNSWER
jgi:hypothetical protein